MPQAQSVDIPKRLPLVITPENRDTSPDKDSKLVNCFSERMQDGTYWIYKRAGFARLSQPPGGAAAGYGVYNWLGDIYAIFGNTLYKNGVSVGTVNTAGGVYTWSSTLGATKKLQLGNGVKAYNYDSGAGLVEITDVDFPSTFVKGWAYLDGTTYVGTPDGFIQGSEINDPTDWDPLNSIQAQIEPDNGVALAKQLVYVVMFKQWSVEAFYDAGNATGSPLAPVQGAKANYGCVTGDSVISVDGVLFWICTNQSASTQVIMMEGLKVQIISTDPVERLLDEADFSTVYALQFKDRGHRFVLWTVKESNITLVYDIDEKMWQQWTDVDGNYFPFVATTYDENFNHIFQHESNGRLYSIGQMYYADDGDFIDVQIITPNYDGDTQRRKQLNLMTFLADQVDGSVMEVYKNDNDYQRASWSNVRTVDLSRPRPQLSNCGTFIRRAFKFRHTANTPFRLKAVELQVDLGTL